MSGLPLPVVTSGCFDTMICAGPVGATKLSVRKSWWWVGCAVAGVVAAPNGVASSAGADADWAGFWSRWWGLDGMEADLSPVRFCHDNLLFMICDTQPRAGVLLEHMLRVRHSVILHMRDTSRV